MSLNFLGFGVCRGNGGSQCKYVRAPSMPALQGGAAWVEERLLSEDFSLLVAFLLFTFSWFFSGFFVALLCLEKQCSGLFRYFFVVFPWLFRGPRFGQILRVLALPVVR